MAQTFVERIKTFAKPDLKWRKPSWRGWLGLAFATLAFVVVTGFFTPAILGWKLIGGFSMEPTLNWRSYVQLEAVTDAHEVEIGDIVCVDNALIGKSTKRVIEIDSQRGLYVVGDNKAITSMDSSYGPGGQEVWIPFADVRYRVKDVLTLRRLWRAHNAEGRFQNWLEFHEPMWAGKPAQNGYLVFEINLNGHGHVFDLVKDGECRRVARLQGQFVDCSGGVLLYRDNKTLRRFDPKTGKSEVVQTKLAPVRSGEVQLIVRNSGQSFFGPTYVLVGKSLPKEVKLRIKGATYSLRSYLEFDYDPLLHKPVSCFGLTPRDDSVPSGTVTATVVSEEP